MYFESFFNKKNLFFGRTKLFVPRKEIGGINPENALGFIPDVIELETAKGPLNFHTLGKRELALNTLT